MNKIYNIIYRGTSSNGTARASFGDTGVNMQCREEEGNLVMKTSRSVDRTINYNQICAVSAADVTVGRSGIHKVPLALIGLLGVFAVLCFLIGSYNLKIEGKMSGAWNESDRLIRNYQYADQDAYEGYYNNVFGDNAVGEKVLTFGDFEQIIREEYGCGLNEWNDMFATEMAHECAKSLWLESKQEEIEEYFANGRYNGSFIYAMEYDELLKCYDTVGYLPNAFYETNFYDILSKGLVSWYMYDTVELLDSKLDGMQEDKARIFNYENIEMDKDTIEELEDLKEEYNKAESKLIFRHLGESNSSYSSINMYTSTATTKASLSASDTAADVAYANNVKYEEPDFLRKLKIGGTMTYRGARQKTYGLYALLMFAPPLLIVFIILFALGHKSSANTLTIQYDKNRTELDFLTHDDMMEFYETLKVLTAQRVVGQKEPKSVDTTESKTWTNVVTGETVEKPMTTINDWERVKFDKVDDESITATYVNKVTGEFQTFSVSEINSYNPYTGENDWEEAKKQGII